VEHYNEIVELLKDKDLSNTFHRYFTWEHDITKDFMEYCDSNSVDIHAFGD